MDANIFVSALIKPEGIPGRELNEVLTSDKRLLILTEAITVELKRILKYPKIRRYINYTDKEIDLWVSSLEVLSHIIKPRFSYPVLVKEDPDDDCYLIAALEGKAQFLISGYKHLLNMNPYKGIRIISAAESLNIIGS